MLCLTKPGKDAILRFIAAQKEQPFSYAEVGCSRGEAPTSYNVDHNRIRLGHGVELFARAKAAIREWKMFDMPWIELCWRDAPIERGATVAVLVSHLGFWSLNACRIVYVIDEPGRMERYGFAYGTLLEHGELGEERFSVEFHSDDETVWYDLYAISRPSPLARVAYPYTRALQKQFARDSQAAMQKFVLTG